MHAPTVLVLLAFNSAAGALALTANLGLSEDMATMLHVAVAAFNMAVLRHSFASLAGPVIILAAGMLAVEGLQTMIPGRSGSLDDIVADLFGLSIGLVVASLRLGRQPRRRRPVVATQRAAPVGWASGRDRHEVVAARTQTVAHSIAVARKKGFSAVRQDSIVNAN